MNIDRNLLRNHGDDRRSTAGAPPLPPDSRRPIAAQPALRPTAPQSSTKPQRQLVEEFAKPAPQRPQFEAQPRPQASNQHRGGDTNISINITMPKLKKPELPNWPWRKIKQWTIIIIVVFIASLVAHAVITTAIRKHKEYEAKHQINMIEQRQNPSFKPLIPSNKAAAIAKTAAYDSRRDSYSYSDTLKGLGLIVSQQPVPTGTDIAKIAKSMNATTPIIASKGTAYLANSSGGAQTVVMQSGSLLVFLQSSFTHSADDWKSYLDTLRS